MGRIALIAAALTLTACGTEAASTATEASNAPATDPVGVAATAPGLAAAVLRHLGAEDTAQRMRGGLVDMEDQRAVTVQLTLDDGRGHLSVSAHDPEYLPGDQGPDECRKEGVRRSRWGTSRCRTLDDGTVVETIRTKYGFSDDNRHGSAAMAMAYGPRGYVQVMFETYARTSSVDVATLEAIASDPAVGWYTTPEMNAEGERLERFVTRDEVD